MPMMGPNGPSVTPALAGQQIAQINQQSAQIQSSAQGLKAAAGTGFHITPDAAATLINSCIHSIDLTRLALDSMRVAGQRPKLGQTPVAAVVAPFTQQVATDSQGMTQALMNLRTTLHDMMDAYYKASTNYQETESIVTQALNAKRAAPPPPAAPPAQGSNPPGRNRAI